MHTPVTHKPRSRPLSVTDSCMAQRNLRGEETPSNPSLVAEVRLPLRVVADTSSGWCLSKWLVAPGASVYTNQRVAVLRSLGSGALDHALAPRSGTLAKHLVAEGERIPSVSPTTPIARIEFCPHSVVFNGLCGICGEDVSAVHFADIASSADSARLPVAYTSHNLSITRAEAENLASITCTNLLKTRRLSLVLDLDHTLVHASDDPRARAILNFSPPSADSDSIKSFSLVPSLPAKMRGIPPCNMYVKLRPHLREFLDRLSKRFELSIYTMGSRPYADQIVKIIDPDKTLFRGRITSREDFAEGKLNQKKLGRLFPCDDSMVLIVDDREDVWISGSDELFMPNLLRAKPYYFWDGLSEAYDRASSTAYPEAAAPVKHGLIPIPKVMPINTVIPITRNEIDKSTILPNSKPLDVKKLTEAMPVPLEKLVEKPNGVKSLPRDLKFEEPGKSSNGESKPHQTTTIKSLPNPVALQSEIKHGNARSFCRDYKLQSPDSDIKAANGVSPLPTTSSPPLETDSSKELMSGNALANGSSPGNEENENMYLEFAGLDEIRIPRKKESLKAGETANSESDVLISKLSPVEVVENGTRTLNELSGNESIEVNATENKTVGHVPNGTCSPPGTKVLSSGTKSGVSEEDFAKMNYSFNSEMRATVQKWWKQDENSDFSGHLLRLAEVLERCHEKFYEIVDASRKEGDPSSEDARKEADVKDILAEMRRTVFDGCVFTFTGVFPLNTVPENSVLWDFATRHGALCCRDFESGVTTHVIASVARGGGTEKARRALIERSAFCVSTDWLDDSIMCWERLPELPYSIHPPDYETNWEDFRNDIDARRAVKRAALELQLPASLREHRIAELKRRNSVGMTYEEHLSKRQKLTTVGPDENAEDDVMVSNGVVEQPVAGRVLTGDEINDALDSLI